MTLPTKLSTFAAGMFGTTGRLATRTTSRNLRNTPINNYSTHSHNHSHIHSHSQTHGHATRAPKRSRGVAAALLAVSVGSASYVAGSLYPPTTLQLINPPPAPPAPTFGTQEAEIYTAALEENLQNLPLTKELRQRQGWYESRPYQNYPEERRRHSLTSGTLRGPGKLALPPLVFAKEDESEAIVIIHVGRSLCGHDGIVHGGLLATLLDETLARNAILNLPSKVGVTANLSVNYRAPARADQFITIHTRLDKANGRKVTVSGTIASVETKEVLTEATALFIQPKYAHLLNVHGEVEKLLGARNNTTSQEVGPDGAKKQVKIQLLYTARIRVRLKMAATEANPIVFYDIYSRDGPWSPNTFKTRLTLNYKRLPYRVEYISIADIETKLKELGVPPSPHGNPVFQYTLPVIADPSSNPGEKPRYVMESFDIAVYLDEKYPAPKYPVVIPPGMRNIQKLATEYVMSVGMSFAPVILPYAALRPGFLDEKGHEYYTRTRRAIAGKDLSEFMDSAEENWSKAKVKWEALGNSLELGGDQGPFVMGSQMTFVDFALGCMLHGVQKYEGGEMKLWKDMKTWQGGLWAVVWAEIAKVEENSSEVIVS
ncbi:unnamed protein product [Rhizoctonia solani]|nr:unnamed protein product [Rhizoctonia solani]